MFMSLRYTAGTQRPNALPLYSHFAHRTVHGHFRTAPPQCDDVLISWFALHYRPSTTSPHNPNTSYYFHHTTTHIHHHFTTATHPTVRQRNTK